VKVVAPPFQQMGTHPFCRKFGLRIADARLSSLCPGNEAGRGRAIKVGCLSGRKEAVVRRRRENQLVTRRPVRPSVYAAERKMQLNFLRVFRAEVQYFFGAAGRRDVLLKPPRTNVMKEIKNSDEIRLS